MTFFSAERCTIIAEVAQAHDGSLGTAHAYIDAIADAGADAVKFQTHIAAAESGPDEPFRVPFSRQDANRYDYWKRLEFTPEQWHGLADHARARGLLFLSSPFSLPAVELLERIGVPAWKVASGEIRNVPLLARMCETGKPIILSTGMSPLAEIDAAVEQVRQHGNEFAVLQCTTAYPCPPERVGLNIIATLRERYQCSAGLSDHSGTIYPGLAAATLGANVLEVHVVFHRGLFGPDVKASITHEELATLVRGVRFVEAMRANPVHKDATPSEAALRGIFMQSLVTTQELAAGTVLSPEHLATRKPCNGIPAAEYDQVIGRALARPLPAGSRLQYGDLAHSEPPSPP